MASSAASVSLLAISMILLSSSMVMATDHIVGDDKGWTTNFDYAQWANSRVFRVGDNLVAVFNYNNSRHNVVKVNGTLFQQCLVPDANQVLSTGKDVITLATSGRKWYICGVSNHCKDLGMKLAITVESEGPSPAPAPAPSAAHSLLQLSSIYGVLMPAMLPIIAPIFSA